MQQSNTLPQRATQAAPTPRRTPSPAQKAVQPLAPIWAACKSKGLPVTPETRTVRAYALNFYLAPLPVDFIESFKDLLATPWAIEVVSGAINDGVLSW